MTEISLYPSLQKLCLAASPTNRRILDYWHAQWDTLQIARALRMSEAEVYNILAARPARKK